MSAARYAWTVTKAPATTPASGRGERPAARAEAASAADSEAPRFIDDYLAFLLAQASHRISGVFHREVEDAGLSVTEWRVLASLSGSAGETIGTLSDLVLTKQPTLSKIVQRMERQGLVARGDTAMDRRQTLVTLTAEGREAASDHTRLALAHQARVLKPLGARDAARLIALLRKLVELPP